MADARTAVPARVTRVAAYALCRDDEGRILACRIARGDPDPGAWTLPGGGLEFGETPEAAVLRELLEETGLVGEIDALVGIDTRHYDASATRSGREVHAVRIVYRVRIVGGELRDEVGGSTDRCAWLSPDELAAVRLVDLVGAALALAG